jgi:hypothetical protein
MKSLNENSVGFFEELYQTLVHLVCVLHQSGMSSAEALEFVCVQRPDRAVFFREIWDDVWLVAEQRLSARDKLENRP